jgi:pimeloyl-ACP methyl ester carboxylesterase
MLGLLVGRPGCIDVEDSLADARALIGSPGFVSARRSFADFAPGPAIETSFCPITVAWGDRDRILTYRTQSARARALRPGAQRITLAQCGHVPFSANPDRCADAILKNTRRG